MTAKRMVLGMSKNFLCTIDLHGARVIGLLELLLLFSELPYSMSLLWGATAVNLGQRLLLFRNEILDIEASVLLYL